MTTLSGTSGFASRKHVPEQDMNVIDLSGTLRLFWSHSSGFALGKKPKKCYIFKDYLPLQEPLVGTFIETHVLICR